MKKTGMSVIKVFITLMIVVAAIVVLPQHTVYAAAPVQVAAVEYYEEQIIVQNNSNTKICFATETDASRGRWETVNADSGPFTMIDISWLSSSKDNVIVIKGADDSTDTTSRITIGRRPLKLSVSINYSNMSSLPKTSTIASMVNIMSSVGTGADPIDFYDLEWRKGDYGQWQSTSSLTRALLEKFLVKGTYLSFRIRAVDDAATVTNSMGANIDLNALRETGVLGGLMKCYQDDPGLTLGTDYPDGTGGRRFSREVKLKIVKKVPAAVYGVDGDEFTVGIKYGKEYRVTPAGGTTSGWVRITDRSIRELSLSGILGNPLIDGTTAAKNFPEMRIEIRNYATAKAAASKITQIDLDEQRTLNSADLLEGQAPDNAIETGDSHIYVSYNGKKNMLLEIPRASRELPYEYCVFKKGTAFDIKRASWTSVTKGTAVKISASKAVEGGTLYIRQKEIKYRKATSSADAIAFQMASTYVSYPINYPSVPEIAKQSFTFTKTYSGDITFDAVLNEAGKVPYETSIRMIKLGTREVNYTAATATVAGVQTMTVTLAKDSLEALPNGYNKALNIIFTNGTVNKTSIKLTIQAPTKSGIMTVLHSKGTNTGTTSLSVVTPKPAGNTWAYVITDAVIEDVYKMNQITDVTTAASVNLSTKAVDNITIAADKYLTVFELDSAGNIIRYKSQRISTAYIQ